MHADWLTSLSGLCRNEDLPQSFWEPDGASPADRARTGGGSPVVPGSSISAQPAEDASRPPDATLPEHAALLWLACCGVALASFALGRGSASRRRRPGRRLAVAGTDSLAA